MRAGNDVRCDRLTPIASEIARAMATRPVYDVLERLMVMDLAEADARVPEPRV